MFNLLPKEQQQNISHEYRLRLADTGLSFLAALAILASVALVPSLLLSYQIESANSKIANGLKKEVASVTSDDPSGKLEFSKKKIAALSAGNPAVYFYELVSTVIHDRTPGIKITGVDVKPGEGETHEVAIVGVASSREALLLFTRVLEKEKHFANVTVPVSNFAPVADINFSVFVKTK